MRDGDQRYTLQVLGGFRLERGERGIALAPGCRRLVGLLAVHGARSREAAAGQLWMDLEPGRAQGNLRTTFWRLRQRVADLLASDGDQVRLQNVGCDLDTVRDWTRRTLLGEQAWPLPPHVGMDLLPLWEEEWLIEAREEFRLLQLQALEVAAQRFLMAGRLPEACSSALAAVNMDPLRESATRLLLEIHIRQGNWYDVRRRFQRFRQLLDEETGMAPSPAVMALVGSLQAHATSTAAGENRRPV